MTRTIPTVQGKTLVLHSGDQVHSISVGTPAWYVWLSTATAFSFVSPLGTFTARKECREQSRWYWRAYRKRAGKLYKAYLGKEEGLSLERLNEVAAVLAGPELAPPLIGERVPEPFPDRSSFASPPGEPILDAFLTTKVSKPPCRPDLVARPRLIERLAAGLKRKLTLISAPTGFGKTTLLSQWSTQSEQPIAWVSLDAADSDPARFWGYVVTALQTLRPHLGDQILRLLRLPQPPPLEALLTNLINALAATPEDLILVLDDYQWIESPAIHSGLAFLLDHLPSPVRVVITSRADPPLPLARLRGKGELTELRAGDLSFSPAETTLFLNELMRLELSVADVAALEECTEGWIVGLQLAGLSIQGCNDIRGFIEAFAGGHRHVVDYLVEEVLRRQPPPIQTFLLQTAVLDRLSGPLGEAVTGLERGQGQAMLETLERANLFTVPLDHERQWYRYHHLFGEALRARLRQTQPEQVPELHRRASLWFRENGVAGEAVSHALAAEEFALAAALIEEAGSAVLRRGELATLSAWLRELPAELVEERPKLRFLEAYAPMGAANLETLEAQLQEVETFLRRQNVNAALDDGGPAAEGDLLSRQRRLAASISLRGRIATYRGDAPLSEALSRQALEDTAGDPIAHSAALLTRGEYLWWKGDVLKASEALAEAAALGQAAGDTAQTCNILTQLAGMYVVQGKLHQAERTYRQAFALVAAQGAELSQVTAMPHGGLGLLLYEWNDLEGALRHAVEGIKLGEQKEVIAAIVIGRDVLTRVKQARGDVEGALQTLHESEQLARANNYTQHVARIVAGRARLWLIQGNVAAAAQWAQAAGLKVDDALSYRRESDHLTLARLLLAQDRLTEAAKLLGRLLAAAEAAGRTGSVIKILALRAIALERQGETDEALSNLGRALALAEPEGYVRTFVDGGGRPLAALLVRLLEARRRNRLETMPPGTLGYAQTLLAAFGADTLKEEGDESGAGMPERSTELLTDRELEVLRFIANGWSPQGIALELIVSINTVKTHMKRIYGKLDAHSGTEAVAKARDLKLL